MRFTVYGDKLIPIGEAESIGQAKALHEKWLAETNHPLREEYLGLLNQCDHLREGMAFPCFRSDMQ